MELPLTDLANFRQDTLHWVGDNLSSFVPPKSIESGKSDFRWKALGELALSLFVLHRAETLRKDPNVQAALDMLESWARRDRFNRDTVAHPGLLRLHLLIIVALERHGRSVPGARTHILAALAMRFQDGMETTPWQDLAMKFLLDAANIESGYPTASELYQRSTLRRLPLIPYLRDHDAYALTHQIFFLSEFGEVDLCPILGNMYSSTCDYLHTLLGVYVLRGHWDLVGELLICCICMDCAMGDVVDVAWTRLLGVQHSSGCVTAPAKVMDAASAQPSVSINDFEMYYHPTLVGLIAASLACEL